MRRGKWTLILIMIGAFSVRLIQIDQPFTDLWSWRQSDVAAIARNFLENGFHFARPQIDWAGNEPGYVGTEFPVLPFVAALIYKGVGVHEWIGRIQGVLFFVAALPFFSLLVGRLFGETAAVWAAFFYAFAPLGIIGSRAFMPDVPSLSLAIAGMYFFLRWLEENRFKWLFSSALLISLALLIKLPTALIGAPLLYLAMGRGRLESEDKDGGLEAAAPWKNPLARWELWLFALITLLPSAIWYWHARRIAEAFYPHHFFGGGGFRIMNVAWYGEIARQTVVSSLTPFLFALAVIGAFVGPRGKYTRLFHWWLAAMVPFVFFVGWGHRHQWYQLPFVPIAAVFAGWACAWLTSFLRQWRSISALVAFVIAAAFVISAYRSAQPFYRSSAASLRELGFVLKEATTRNSLIIAATDGDPTVFYYAQRKGWHFPGDGIYQGHPRDNAQLIDNFEKLRARGATHLVFYAGTRWWLDYYREFADRLVASATLVEETPEFTIFRLQPSSVLPPP